MADGVVNRLSDLLCDACASPVAEEPPQVVRVQSRWRALHCAWNGIGEAWRSQPHVRLHAAAAGLGVAMGLWLRLTLIEWLSITFAIGLVLFAEMMNTAIEQTVDLVVGSRLDPLARQVKDIAAGCVLVAAAIAVLIGALTFGPHLLNG